TPFKQQKLKAWQPILTPNWVIGTFFVVGLIFIPIGIILRLESDNVVEYSIQYDGDGKLDSSTQDPVVSIRSVGGTPGACALGDGDGNTFDLNRHGCLLSFKLDKDMKAPTFVYYQLDNFYQNHRRYVASRSDEQLRGNQPSTRSDCDPMQMSPDNTVNVTTPTGVRYTQTDTYPGTSLEVVNLMSQSGIAWKSDIASKFDNIKDTDRRADEMYLWQNPNYRNIIPKGPGLPRVLNKTAWTSDTTANFGVKSEHFIVWMRTAGLPNFRKLYGRIDTDLPAGSTLEFLVSSSTTSSLFEIAMFDFFCEKQKNAIFVGGNTILLMGGGTKTLYCFGVDFVVSAFEGKKSLVLSTTSWFGGRNPFLGVAYITVGSLCMVLSILFFAKHKLSPRKLGDTRYLVWKNNQ
ncbi:hypothetical protein DYB31_012850, partial [Aphanomyces astaci]